MLLEGYICVQKQSLEIKCHVRTANTTVVSDDTFWWTCIKSSSQAINTYNGKWFFLSVLFVYNIEMPQSLIYKIFLRYLSFSTTFCIFGTSVLTSNPIKLTPICCSKKHLPFVDRSWNLSMTTKLRHGSW